MKKLVKFLLAKCNLGGGQNPYLINCLGYIHNIKIPLEI